MDATHASSQAARPATGTMPPPPAPGARHQAGHSRAGVNNMDAPRSDAHSVDPSTTGAATAAARPIVRRRRWRAQVRATGPLGRPQSTSTTPARAQHSARVTSSTAPGQGPQGDRATLQLPVDLLPRLVVNRQPLRTGVKRRRDAKQQPQWTCGTVSSANLKGKPEQPSEATSSPVAAVLASRFLASNRAAKTAATTPSPVTRATPAVDGRALQCTLAIDRRTRELMVRVANPGSEAAAALVQRLHLDGASASATAALSGTHGAVVVRLPTTRMCEAILVATCTRIGETDATATTNDTSMTAPAVRLSFVGAAAPALRATTRRLVATARCVRTVLTSRAAWPVLMTYVPADRRHERWLSVDSFADVHRHITGECLDLVRHRSVEALLRIVPGVEVMRIGERAVCRLAPQYMGHPPAEDLPHVEEVPTVDAATSFATSSTAKLAKQEPALSKIPRRQMRSVTGDGPVDATCDGDVEMRAEPRVAPRPAKRARKASTPVTRVKVEPAPPAPRTRQSPAGGSPGVSPADAPASDAAPRPLLVADLFISAARALAEQERLLADAAADMQRQRDASDGAALSPHCHMGVQGLSPHHWQSSDPWECLGLSRDATPAQVRRRYRLLALRLHPDKCDADHAAAAFAAVAAAYDVVACAP